MRPKFFAPPLRRIQIFRPPCQLPPPQPVNNEAPKVKIDYTGYVVDSDIYWPKSNLFFLTFQLVQLVS